MRKTKMVFVSLLAVFALGAIVSASASAALWQVAGSTTFGTEGISNAAIAITGGKLTGDGIEISCPTLKIEGGLIKEGNTGMATSAMFSECKELIKSAECKLSSETITTHPGTADLTSATEIEIKPEGANTEFVSIKVENQTGKECGLNGTYKITGSALLNVGNASTEETEHMLELSKNSKLDIGNKPSTIAGSGKGMLTSLKKWSIMALP